MTNVSVTSGFRAELLKTIYGAYEPNYPGTLHKLVMYPVSSMLVGDTPLWIAHVGLNRSLSYITLVPKTFLTYFFNRDQRPANC